MKNLKTLTALAAVMLAGLAAPMAAASHSLCHYDESLARPSNGNSATDGETLADGAQRIYRLESWGTADQVFLQNAPVSGLTMSIVKAPLGVCSETAIEEQDQSYTFGDVPGDVNGEAIFVVIQNPTGGTGSTSFTLEYKNPA